MKVLKEKALYKEITDAVCPDCRQKSKFRSVSAEPHTIYRCGICGDSSLTYESIAEANPGTTIVVVGVK